MTSSRSRKTLPILLASASPRRRELLGMLGLAVEVDAVEVDETPRVGESAQNLARRLSRAKARAAAARYPGRLVIAADTVVTVGNQVLGKPRSRAEAVRMLKRLSGRWHEVVTGVALVEPGGALRVAHSRTRVRFARLTAGEIAAYAASPEPHDKAGAYAVQGRAAWFVSEIRGSVTNVIGLPLEKVRALLARAGVPPPSFSA